MSNHWSKVLLSLTAATLLFSACKKTSSSDAPLPVNYNPSIIVGNDNYEIYALDPVSGKKNWELALPAPITASPMVYGGMVYVGTTAGDTLYKINSKTGQMVQKIVADSRASFVIKATPMADAGLIYLAGTNSVLYAIDTATGKTKWTYTADGTSIVSSPVVYNGKVYFATTGGSVYCVDKTQGGTLTDAPFTPTAAIWKLTIPRASFSSSPAVGGQYLFVGSTSDSNMYCIYLNEPTVPAVNLGVVRWKFKTNGGIYSSPAAYHGRCIFGCEDFNVYCLDTAINPPLITTPEAIWTVPTGSQIFSSPYVDNQVVYIGSYDYFLYALNIIDGSTKWRFKTSGLIRSSPLVYNSNVYVASYDGNLYAVDSVRGTQVWSQNTNGQIESSPVIDNLTGAQVNSQVSGFTQSGNEN